MAQTELSLFFIVEPPRYQMMACYLAASLRNHLPPEVELIGYCPAHRIDEIDPAVTETLRRMRCEIRPFQTHGRFDPAYPHGNKLLACLEPRDSRFSGFMDSDILMLQDNAVSNLVAEGAVSASVAASMYWMRQQVWAKIYAIFGMEVPDTRVTLMRDQRRQVIPYYSSGFVTFPETFRDSRGLSFPQIWMETAQAIDATPDISNKRPYLDQLSLPIAIQRAGLSWRSLPEEQHYILGGTIRGEPLPKDRKIYTVHYRNWDVLKEAGLAAQGYGALRKQIGHRRVSNVFAQALPNGIAPPAPGSDKAAPSDAQLPPAAAASIAALKPSEPPVISTSAASAPAPVAASAPAPRLGPDPSRAPLAVVTMVHEDYAFLEIWVRYYAKQVGREHLYVLRHGLDPQIDRIAAGCNIIHLPQAEDKSGFDRRRWTALSNFTSGLTLYYNWVMCNDVDEIVAVDPEVSPRLVDYLMAKLDDSTCPKVISPFALEIVHTPATEPAALAPEQPVLALRRNFRLNSNYAKPCLTRNRIAFSIGGHGCTSKDVALDPHLYLFHLRYMDEALSRARLAKRKAWMEEKNGPTDQDQRKKTTWDQGDEAFNQLSTREPVAQTIEFPDFRQAMQAGRSMAQTGNWFFRNMRTKELYSLPERFTALF